MLTLFGEAISGAHYNPAISLVFMLRKNSSHFGSRRLKGIFYMIAQLLGGLIAALISKFLLKGDGFVLAATPMVDGYKSYRITASMISEFVGSFVFIFLFMLCTDKKTQYSEDKVINCFIMSSAYISARLMAGGAFITHLTGSYKTQENDHMITLTKTNYVGPLLNPALAIG